MTLVRIPQRKAAWRLSLNRVDSEDWSTCGLLGYGDKLKLLQFLTDSLPTAL
jgi:hypothetical protein